MCTEAVRGQPWELPLIHPDPLHSPLRLLPGVPPATVSPPVAASNLGLQFSLQSPHRHTGISIPPGFLSLSRNEIHCTASPMLQLSPPLGACTMSASETWPFFHTLAFPNPCGACNCISIYLPLLSVTLLGNMSAHRSTNVNFPGSLQPSTRRR